MAQITLVGSGKAATALGKALLQAGHSFVQIWSRTTQGAEALAKLLNATPVTDITAINNAADIYLIAVKDDTIAEVAEKLNAGNKIVAHTSGVKSKNLLVSSGINYGIFYPFVSMTKESATDFNTSLLMVEGSNEATINILEQLAKTISGNVKIVHEDQRQSLHLAAVFAQNFTNHMYSIADKILLDKGLEFDTLRPLIISHIANVMKQPPTTLQTGPAIRNDKTTINEHLKLLSHNVQATQLYLAITDAIQQWYK